MKKEKMIIVKTKDNDFLFEKPICFITGFDRLEEALSFKNNMKDGEMIIYIDKDKTEKIDINKKHNIDIINYSEDYIAFCDTFRVIMKKYYICLFRSDISEMEINLINKNE